MTRRGNAAQPRHPKREARAVGSTVPGPVSRTAASEAPAHESDRERGSHEPDDGKRERRTDEDGPRGDERKQRRHEEQAGRVRAAVRQRDEADHAPEQRVGHFLLSRRVEQHDGRALAERRGECTRDRDPERAGQRHQTVAGQVKRPRKLARGSFPPDRHSREQDAAHDRAERVADHHERESTGPVVKCVAYQGRHAADPRPGGHCHGDAEHDHTDRE